MSGKGNAFFLIVQRNLNKNNHFRKTTPAGHYFVPSDGTVENGLTVRWRTLRPFSSERSERSLLNGQTVR